MNLIVKLGLGNSKWVIILHDYKGQAHVGPDLLHAIEKHGHEKYGNAALTKFDHVEILGED